MKVEIPNSIIFFNRLVQNSYISLRTSLIFNIEFFRTNFSCFLEFMVFENILLFSFRVSKNHTLSRATLQPGPVNLTQVQLEKTVESFRCLKSSETIESFKCFETIESSKSLEIIEFSKSSSSSFLV